MNSLKSELISDTDSFEHLARKLMSKKIVTMGKEYIENMKADFFVKPRDLLSSFMIYKFPDDSIGPPELESNKNVIDSAKMFIECDEADQKKNLVKFIHHFKKWKESDKEVLESQLFNEYHQLTVDILNTDDPDKKLVYETVQGEIEKVIDEVISDNPKMVEEYIGGKEKLLGFFVGQAMQKTKGKANPKILNEILKSKLK